MPAGIILITSGNTIRANPFRPGIGYLLKNKRLLKLQKIVKSNKLNK